MIPFARCKLVAVNITFTGTRTVLNDTAIDLADNATYVNLRYGPSLAPIQQQSTLANARMPAVTDTLTFDIVADTPSLAYAAWERVMDLLDRGAAYYAGKNYVMVELHAQVERSTATWIARVFGPPAGEAPSAPSGELVIIDGRERYVIRDVSITFLRSPLWVDYNTVVTQNAAINTPPPWMTLTMYPGTAPLAPYTATVTWPQDYVAPANQRNEIYIVSIQDAFQLVGTACTGGVAPGYTTDSDSQLAPGGVVLRYTPSGSKVSNVIYTAVNWPLRNVQAFLAVRPNNSASAFLVGLRWTTETSSSARIQTYDTPMIYVAGTDPVYGTERPRIIAFPPTPLGAQRWSVQIRAMEAVSPGVGSCDFAYLIIAPIDRDSTRITCVRLTPTNASLIARTLTLQPDALSGQVGGAVIGRPTPPTESFLLPFVGEVDRVVGASKSVAFSVFGTHQNKWVIYDNANTPMYPTITTTAYLAQRLPS